MRYDRKDLSKTFTSHAPGYWADDPPADWDSSSWQLKNRVNTLAQIEEHLTLCEEERSGILLSGTKLALSITPHFFNLIDSVDPEDAIRRQIIPRIEETV